MYLAAGFIGGARRPGPGPKMLTGAVLGWSTHATPSHAHRPAVIWRSHLHTPVCTNILPYRPSHCQVYSVLSPRLLASIDILLTYTCTYTFISQVCTCISVYTHFPLGHTLTHTPNVHIRVESQTAWPGRIVGEFTGGQAHFQVAAATYWPCLALQPYLVSTPAL